MNRAFQCTMYCLERPKFGEVVVDLKLFCPVECVPGIWVQEPRFVTLSLWAYGLQIYWNDMQMNMHMDKGDTHIISCILHIDHDDDPESEPWPIVIEDFQGNTNKVVLESSDLLFYESSK